jgi:tetratricopeptide (TPR) repeat protein
MWKEGTGKARQALKEAKELIRLGTTYLLTYWEVGIDLIDGRYDEAINALMSETADSINDQFIYFPKSLLFAEVYYTQKKMDKASAYYDSARTHLITRISESPQDSRYHSSLGIVYAGLGKKVEAIREGQAGVDLMPITKDFYKGIFRLKDLARIYTMVGEYEKALEVIDQLLSMPSLMSVNLVKKEPVWEPLWELPDFKKLIEEHSQY